MSTYGYIKATGDSDYNFGHNDFTVEFFMRSTGATSNTVQTLFEITNNESPAALYYQKTRFLTVIEYGNLNAYAFQTVSVMPIGANVSYFTSPIPISSDYRIFYDGKMLQNGQYTVNGSNISLTSNVISSSNTVVELGEILFQTLGNQVTTNVNHFVSAERYRNQFYLFLDGNSQNVSVPAYQAIPSQGLPWTNNSNVILNRTNSPALLTIGANHVGNDPFFGSFGDFKITNGISRHVASTQIHNTISSTFIDSSLGHRSADINIEGGGFIDNISSPAPEEYVPAQIFDTLDISVYQSDNANLNSNILGFKIFKPLIMAGPLGSYTINITANTSYRVPWTTLNSSDAAISINGVPQPTTNWVIKNNILTITLGSTTSGNIQIVPSGPTSYFTIGASGVSTLTSNLYSNSNVITVSNVAGFITPVIGPYGNSANVIINARGQVFINQECITYLYIDRVNNVLSGLQRGVAGTGVPTVHTSASQVISASYDRDLSHLANVDPGKYVWYTTPFNNTSLQNTSTPISNILVSQGTVPPTTPF